MSSPETFLAYGAIMLIIALVGVAIDWFGKPLRHRKFIPKSYKFPDERLFRSQVFNPKPILSTPEIRTAGDSDQHFELTKIPLDHQETAPKMENDVHGSPPIDEHLPLPIGNDSEVVTDQASSSQENNDSEEINSTNHNHHAEAIPEPTGVIRLHGWSPGGYIYNLTQEGKEPSPSTVRARFWKNVGVASGSAIFGSLNVDRLREGKPPQRRNPRTGKTETMKVPLLSFKEGGGITPIPHWPTKAVDPFGESNA